MPTREYSPYGKTQSRSPPRSSPSTAPTSYGSPDERLQQAKLANSDYPEDSLSATPATSTPAPPSPVPDPHDPYRRSKRKPQPTNLAEIPERFHFDKVTRKRQNQQFHHHDQHPTSPTSHSGGGLLRKASNKSIKDPLKEKLGHDSSGDELHDEHSSSQVSLRRFFRGGDKKKHPSRPSTPVSPSAPTSVPYQPPRGGTPPGSKRKAEKKSPTSTMPFGDDHAGLGLTERYGKFGKVLGAGAGGSVRLMKRASDGTTFAVKEFRPRAEHETQREYAKKVNAEFTIGSILSHQNIIETLDIVNEGGRYFEVMEYCRYDLV